MQYFLLLFLVFVGGENFFPQDVTSCQRGDKSPKSGAMAREVL